MKKVKMFVLMLLLLVFAPSQVGAKYSLATKNIPVNRKKDIWELVQMVLILW